jgi:hypothetical protein
MAGSRVFVPRGTLRLVNFRPRAYLLATKYDVPRGT